MQGILDRSRCRQTTLRATSVGRYYDPSTAQFLSIDPLVGITGAPYSYAGDNPLDGTDPLGLDCRNTDSCPPSTSYSQENGYSPSLGHMDNADPTPQNETISSGTSATAGNGSSQTADKKSEGAVSCPAGTTLQTMTPTTVPGASNEPQCVTPHSDSSWVGTVFVSIGHVLKKASCVVSQFNYFGGVESPGSTLLEGAAASGWGIVVAGSGAAAGGWGLVVTIPLGATETAGGGYLMYQGGKEIAAACF